MAANTNKDKETETAAAAEAAKEDETAAAKAPKMVTVMVPRSMVGDMSKFLGYNGRFWQVKRGEAVKLPAPVAKVLQDSLDAEEGIIKEREKARAK